MAKLLVFLGVFGLLFVSAIAAPEPLFIVEGKVFSDYCRVGYELNPYKPCRDSEVLLQCTTRDKNNVVTHTQKAVTGADGCYSIPVNKDMGDHFCQVLAVRSSDPECSTPSKGRDRAPVTLTRGNGLAGNKRYANALGFERPTPLARCPQLLQQYEDLDSTD